MRYDSSWTVLRLEEIRHGCSESLGQNLQKDPTAVSWYRPHLETSLSLIERVASKDSAIIDIGGGESTLVDDLLSRGHDNITVLDISQKAISENKKRLGNSANVFIGSLPTSPKLNSLNRPTTYGMTVPSFIF